MSMLENRLLKKNTIQLRVNRFNNPTFISEGYNSFDFNKNLKSVHLKDLEFTNYVSSKECKKYKDLQDICIRINRNKNELENLFIADELGNDTSILKYERLLKILSAINDRQIDQEEVILKFKNIADNEIQFYIKNENGNFKLYMIDMYHIGIEAVNRKTGRADRKGIYKARKECSCDIAEIQKKLNKSSDKPREI